MKSEKLGTDVYFTNYLNHSPQRYYDKKASIETTREQLAIVTSQLQVVGSYIDDVTIGQKFETIGSARGVKCGFTSVKLSHRNDRCTEYTEPEMYCSMRAVHLGFGGDSGYFSQLYI